MNSLTSTHDAAERARAVERPCGSEERDMPLSKSYHLLLAEDDPVGRRVLEGLLQLNGFRFDSAGDGLEAVEMWEAGAYDLLLTDIRMPRLSGLEAARAIRQMELQRGGRIPIVAMSADDVATEELLAAGIDAYVPKPIDFKRLIEVIQGVLEQNQP